MKRIYQDYMKKAVGRLKYKVHSKDKQEICIKKIADIIVVDEIEFQIVEAVNLETNYVIVPRDAISIDMYPKVIAWLGNVEKEQLKMMPNLRWLQVPSAGWNGYEKMDLYANPNEITLTNLRGIFDIPIAEYCCCSMLMVSREAMCLSVLPWKSYPRTEECFRDLEGSNVLIVGAGSIGTEIAKKLHGLGVQNLYGIRNHVVQSENFSKVYSMNELKSLVDTMDYIISTLPESEETNNIFNKTIFDRMKKTAYFINVGRGNAVDESDLRKALKERKIAGAILDVTKRENKFPITILDRTPGLILTRHRSSLSKDNQQRKNSFAEKQIRAFIKGETLCNVKK